MMNEGVHYSRSGARMVEVKRMNPDQTYATVFHTKTRNLWTPVRSDFTMTEQEVQQWLMD